jgi:polar amino acid transport system substrate-binding protein
MALAENKRSTDPLKSLTNLLCIANIQESVKKKILSVHVVVTNDISDLLFQQEQTSRWHRRTDRMFEKLRVNRFLILLLLLADIGLLSGCTSTGKTKSEAILIAPDKNILRVGVTTNSPPLIYKQGDKIVGLEADFAKELALYLGRSLRFIELEWEDLIPSLLENRIDILMSGMARTPLREVRISFTIPYFKSGQMALIRREDLARFSAGYFSFMTSSAIGVVKGTTAEYFVEARYGSVKKKKFSTSQKAVDALIDKKIDMFIHDALTILYIASENEARSLTALRALLTSENLAWGVRKDNVEMLKSANSFLQNPDNEKRLKELINHWIPFSE